MNEPKRAARHPESDAEQAYIDAAYRRLEEIRAEALALAEAHAAQRHTSFQAAYERDVTVQTAYQRARALDIGDRSLVFGRVDRETGDRHYIGRRAVFDERYEPLVIDWRVPSAEAFYRATGRHPMGLRQRRHFLCEGRQLLAIEDEHFGEANEVTLAGQGALLAAMERPRTGHMRDIVATVQAEQDEIIRDELAGVLAVQGGPGTGKTAVGLHRAAYLLFTYRQKLERQGILVVGPNRRFLRYIDQVLPSLGEAGVELETLADLAPPVPIGMDDPPRVAALKGDARMAEVIARAVRLYERGPGRGATITLEGIAVQLSKRELHKLVASARRSGRSHNARRAMLVTILVDRIYRRYRSALKRQHGALAEELRLRRRDASTALRADPELRALVEDAWPLLRPQRVVGDLLTSRSRLAEAGAGILTDEEIDLLRRDDPEAWSAADVPLLDEAAVHVGAAVERRRVVSLEDDDTDDVATFGHVIVDEAQDLTAMALRMIARRSRTGSITLVGDLAQATGPSRPRAWEELLALLPQRDGTRVRELTVNYRTPGSIMAVAARVLAEAAPDLTPPRSARADGEPIRFVDGDPAAIVAGCVEEHRARGAGTMAVIVPASLQDAMRAAADVTDDDEAVAVLTVEDAKGLEFDQVLIVEPGWIAGAGEHGLRALYIALTRATQRVTIAHADPLPPVLQLARG